LPQINVLDERVRNPAPQAIGLFDDVMTAGAHYRAGSNVLRKAYPSVRVIGLFIARRVPEAVDWDEFEL
jgi:predicted amidophosphoribosyltransferase